MRRLKTIRQIVADAEDAGDNLDDLAVDEADVIDLSELDADQQNPDEQNLEED